MFLNIYTHIFPQAVRHLPLSSQIEYKNLLAKMQLLEKQKQCRLKSQPKSKVNVEEGGNIKVTVENAPPTTPENAKKPTPRKVLGNKVTVLARTTSESSDTFESRVSKMSEHQKGIALEKYETNYNDFRFISRFPKAY